jgi:hypothetical protein
VHLLIFLFIFSRSEVLVLLCCSWTVAVTSRLISRLAFLPLARLCEQHPVPSLGFGFFFCCCFSRTQHRPDFIFLWLVLLALSSSLPREDFYFAADNPCAGYFGPWARAALFPGHALDFSTDRSVFHCFSVPVFLAILLLRFSLLPFFNMRARLSLSSPIRAHRDSPDPASAAGARPHCARSRFHPCAAYLSWSLVVPARELLLLCSFSWFSTVIWFILCCAMLWMNHCREMMV